MNYPWKLLREYTKTHFNARLYLATLLWVAFLLAVNYVYDFENSYIDPYTGSYIRIIIFFFVHLLPYLVTCYFIQLFTTQRIFEKRKFWLLAVIGFTILAFDRGQYFDMTIAKWLSDDYYAQLYLFRIISRWIHTLTLILPIFLLSKYYQKESSFYGLEHVPNFRPYLLLLLLITPLIVAASFSPAFLKQYPKFEMAYIAQFSAHTGMSEVVALIGYEIGYAVGFINVEIFFRGFLIFGLVRYVGPQVVLPMAVTYCVLHFGKPMGEAISSIFGGYMLGILALKTRNIYGGIFLHVGIAWLMELCAYLVKHSL